MNGEQKPTSSSQGSQAGERRGLRLAAHRAAKDLLCGWLYPRTYRKSMARPVNPRKVLFVESKLREMPDSFALVWKRLQELGGWELEYRTLDSKSVGLVGYTKNCRALVRDMADAAYVFLCDANDIVSSVPLRPETKVVQLWHACGAFKKWGMSSADKKFGSTALDIARHPYYGNLSLVTISAPEVAWAYIEAMHLEATPQVVQATGVSRTDVFFDEGFLERARARVQSALPGIEGRKIVLYAPTFRGNVRGAQGPDFLDLPLLRERIGGEYALLVKHHPYVEHPPEIPASCEDFAFDITHAGLAIDELIASADLCVTDYSSMVFEWSLFERPIAFFAPDIADYDDWRGFFYDYDELTPGPVFTRTEELVSWVQGLSRGFDTREIHAFRERFMGACDGHSTDRILSRIGILPPPGSEHERT